MKKAMKAKDARLLSALRMIVSAIRYAQIDDSAVDEVVVLKKEAKKRKEAIEAYRIAGRGEAQENEAYELAVIERYLPQEMSEEEVRVRVVEVLKGQKFDNFGMAMNYVMKELGKEANGGVVAKVVRELWHG